MGNYIDLGNELFKETLNGGYVDKTGLVEYINSTISTPDKLTCFSRPRRFGKTIATYMLTAYYDRSCDSRELFEGLEISKSHSFETYLNKLNVICLDISGFIQKPVDRNIVEKIQSAVIEELSEKYPGLVKEGEASLASALMSINKAAGEKFFIIIDEWDALMREADVELQEKYIWFLRGLFKGGQGVKKAIAGAYMTGILPIKKYGTQSALTDFRELTMLEPAELASYVGFTEEDVKGLCGKSNLDFEEMKDWYDGYSFTNLSHVYSPNSVMNAVNSRIVMNYWDSSETFESLRYYIDKNFAGLKDAVTEMLAGKKIKINTISFQNDMVTFNSRDDVLALLVHLGYLAYEREKKTVCIPNLEVSEVFTAAVGNSHWKGLSDALLRSDDLLDATLAGNSGLVAEALEDVHVSESSVLSYNNEESLCNALIIAYYSARRFYHIKREMPLGKGFADLAFIPKKNVDKSAMIVELKCDESADTAIRQIKERRYQGELKDYAGKVILVGINYDRKTKKHTCVIEQE